MKTKVQKAGLFLLVSYTLLLIFCMFFGFGRQTSLGYRYNIVPFSTIKLFLNFSRFNTSTWVINLIGNIGVFIPFGILLPIVFKEKIGLLYIKFITGIFLLELMQLLSRRGSFDIDDLILNSVGFLIGYWIYLVIFMCLKK